jgi:tRNA (mo5U34)-methyltransferase
MQEAQAPLGGDATEVPPAGRVGLPASPVGPTSRDGAGPHPGIVITDAEREVADLLPIRARPADALAALERVPFWFHTFALNGAVGIYTPGAARGHRHRVAVLPEDCSGLRVLDVGTFDGFYAFLAEARGAERVLAVDNEQYRAWVRARWGIELEGGEGFRAIRRLLRSGVEYWRIDAFEIRHLEERFDLVYCFGILERVENPLGLLRVLRACLNDGGRVLLETHGAGAPDEPSLRMRAPGEVYPGDDHVHWGFTAASLGRLATCAGFGRTEIVDEPVVEGHPHVLGILSA